MIQLLTDSVLAITGFQLLLLVVVLLRQSTDRNLQRNLLVAFLVTKALLILRWSLFRFGAMDFQAHPYAYLISSAGFYLLAPLLYLYVRALCHRRFRLQILQLAHLLPFIGMVVLAGTYIYAHAPTASTSLTWITRISFWDLFWTGNFIQILIYLVAMIATVRIYRRQLRDQFSAVEKMDLTWLSYLLAVIALHWLFVVSRGTLGLLNAAPPTVTALLDLFSITIFLGFTTTLVIKGLGQLRLLTGLEERPRYAASPLDEASLTQLAERLRNHMRVKKPHLDPDLTLRSLSDEVSVPSWQLSQVINRVFNLNFFNFVNRYRVEEAKARLQDPARQRATILEILLDVGFNSKSTFNEAFKRHTGLTPSQFKKLNPDGGWSRLLSTDRR